MSPFDLRIQCSIVDISSLVEAESFRLMEDGDSYLLDFMSDDRACVARIRVYPATLEAIYHRLAHDVYVTPSVVH